MGQLKLQTTFHCFQLHKILFLLALSLKPVITGSKISASILQTLQGKSIKQLRCLQDVNGPFLAGLGL